MILKVLSYNIHKGFETFGVRFILHEMKAALKETDADILLLQEVVGANEKHKIKHHNWPKETQFEFLADTVWPHFSYGKNAVFPYRHHGNAVLSRFPLIQEENINISTNQWEQRGLLHCLIRIPYLDDLHLHLMNVHLNLTYQGRRKQIQKIIDRITHHVPNDSPLILAGDFNDWHQKISSILELDTNLKESFKVLDGKSAKTFPSFFPFLSLDRIYFRGMKAISCHVKKESHWTQLSDHMPLYVEFEV